MRFLNLAALFLFGVSLTGIPAYTFFLQNRIEFLIWGGIFWLLGTVVALFVDDGMCKLLNLEWEIYITSVALISLSLLIGVLVQWL